MFVCHARRDGLGKNHAEVRRALNKKRPPFPKVAASLFPLFPDFQAGGVGGGGPDDRGLVSTSKPRSPSFCSLPLSRAIRMSRADFTLNSTPSSGVARRIRRMKFHIRRIIFQWP